ncbi:MAG: hypothetical protein BroJett025_02850 [Patescibacteria group bacterium]|nr:MAG: hypothetical protein BroJett025_02850 [Patescibacteria group bacterium]
MVLVLITSQSKQNIPQTNETPPLKNPTPDSIQILGVEEANTQIAAESKEKKPISFETQALYRLINSYRTENDLNKLFVDRTLEDSANRKLSDMITKEYFRHADSNNNESWYLFQAAGYQYKFAGENLSFGNNTPWQVFEAWQKSPEHNAQLLKSEYLDMGLAVNCDAYKVGTTHSCIVVLHIGAR